MARHPMLLALTVLVLASSTANAQTTAGTGTTIVFPVTAQTSSFASEVTIFNPGPNALTAHVTFFEANNSSTPGTKVCADTSVPANRSVQFSIGTQCPLAAGSHFGLLIVADSAQTNAFYGYTRVQNPNGIGFSIEGFPVGNFNNQVSHSTGLKRQAAAPTYQTNCFVGSLEQPVSYEVRLFDDTTGAQIGGTLTGSLNAFEQFRYLDVFGPTGVNAPAGDQFNVRAQFAQTSGGTANLIGFCTVQDNTSFGADFRIAKSYGVPGTVTNLAQGSGILLTPNPITTAGTIAADTSYVQRRVSASCAAGSSIQSIAADGTVTCQMSNAGTVTSVGTGSGLTGGPITTSGTINLASTQLLPSVACGTNQVPKWNGSAWSCAADANNGGTVTSVTAGAGLTGGTITTSGTLAVDPTSSTLTSNFFAQGGNTFGTTAKLGSLDNQPLEIYVNNQRAMRFEPNTVSPNILGGHPANGVNESFAGQTIAGGGVAGSTCYQPSTGTNVRICTNHTSNFVSSVGGGQANQATAVGATVAGGVSNDASGAEATVTGGFGNSASGEGATVAGGWINKASGTYSMAAGGAGNVASGVESFAAGHNSTADQSNCVVFGLWSSGTSSCLGTANVFKIMGDNGFSVDYHLSVGGGGDRWLAIGPFTTAGGLTHTTIITWTGAYLSDAGVWVNGSSSRERKKDFEMADVEAVLRGVLALPITTWRYKEGEGDVRHMGPMAEDFWQAFKIGYGSNTIADLDARGVEFAAIQGLHHLIQEKDARIAALERQVSSQQQQISELQSLRGALAALTARIEGMATAKENIAGR